MSDNENMPRGFKGIWIPSELWLDHRLTLLEKALVAEIDSLDCSDDHCFASNEYLAEMCQTSTRTIRTILSKLKKLGFIEEVGFNGRTRMLKSFLKSIYADFSHAGRKLASTLGGSTLPPSPPMESHSAGEHRLEQSRKEAAIRSEDPMFITPPKSERNGGSAPKPPTAAAFSKAKEKAKKATTVKETVEDAIKKAIPEGERRDDALAYYAKNKDLVDGKTNPPGWILTKEKRGGCKGFANAERQREEWEANKNRDWALNEIHAALQQKKASVVDGKEGAIFTLKTGESRVFPYEDSHFGENVFKFLGW